MPQGTNEAARRLALAKAGSRQALGEALEACREYLLRLAMRELDPGLQAKAGASDLVQQTFCEAQRDFAQFRGESEAELLGWLRQALLNNVAHFRRHYRETGKRQVNREVPVGPGLSSSMSRVEVAADTPTPSRELIDAEKTALLEHALERLPEDYQQVLALRYDEDRSFEEIAQLMNRSANAARKLWARALERLREEMEQPLS